jgi:putative ABC transport system permease protein
VVDMTVTHKSGSGFPMEVANKLEGITGIRASSALLERSVNLPANFIDGNPKKTDRITALNLTGVTPEAAQSLHAYFVQAPGRFLKAEDTSAAVISQTLADAYGVKTGETIKIPSVNGIETLTVVGILPSRSLPGNEEVLVPLAQAQAMTGQAGQITSIEVALTSMDEGKRNQTLAAIETALGNEYQVGALQSDSEMFASVRMGQAALNMFGVLSLFMGGFIIFNTFRTVIAERRRDIGMLRALGARRNTITGMILFEGLLQGSIGSGIGLILGYLFGAGVILLMQKPLSTFINLKMGAPIVSASLVVTSIMLGVGITLLAGLIPASNASRITPMDALRPSVAESKYKHSAGIGFIFGLVMIGASLLALTTGNMDFIFLGAVLFLIGLILVAPVILRPIAFVFGKLLALVYAREGTGDLAQGNLTRQTWRVVITASATMIGLAIVVALGGMTSSLSGMMDKIIHKSLASDYLFVPPSVSLWSSDIGSGPEFIDRLQAIPGVGDISNLRFAESAINGQKVSLLGIDPKTFPEVSGLDFMQGDESAYRSLVSGRSMIVNGAFLATIPVEVGGEVTLETPNGPQRYTVAAKASDLLNAKVVTAWISQANLAADFGRSDDVFIQLNLKPGINPESVEAQIRTVASDYPQYTVIAGKSYRTQLEQLLNGVFAGMYIMLAFLALPSLIAMLNTLTISVLERKREIGMLRAVGGTRKQVHRMVVAEAILLAAVGTAFGILAGIYLGYVIVRAMETIFPMAFSFPFAGILAGVATGLLFGGVAAIIPARQAARLQVVEALRYE